VTKGIKEIFLYKDLMLAFLLLCRSKPVNNYEREQRIILTFILLMWRI